MRSHRHWLDEDRYFVVTGTAFGEYDLGWLQQQRDELVDVVDDVSGVELVDATSTYTCYDCGACRPGDPAGRSPEARSGTKRSHTMAQRLSIGSVP